jgi:flagellar biosynthesis protein FlhF
MKMKMFTAPTVAEAMEMVRAEFGQEAVILSTRDEDGVAEVRAAVERIYGSRATPKFREAPSQYESARADLAERLRLQDMPRGLGDLLAEAGGRLGAGLEPFGALAASLETAFTFAPLIARPERSYLLVGPPGAGRTQAAARLALDLDDGESGLVAVAADFNGDGNHLRLAYHMGLRDVDVARTPAELRNMVVSAEAAGMRLVIDGPAFNVVQDDHLTKLNALISCMNVEPVLVVSADSASTDLEDNLRLYAQCGVRRLILTKLDTIRRFGATLGAISSARLSIAQLALASSSPGGLAPASSAELARLLMAGAPEADQLKGAA